VIWPEVRCELANLPNESDTANASNYYKYRLGSSPGVATFVLVLAMCLFLVLCAVLAMYRIEWERRPHTTLHANVPHVALCPPVVQSCLWHASPQYRAILHSGQTLKSFRCPTTSQPLLWQ